MATLEILTYPTVNDIIECFQLARELGFDNINMDIIVGLPDENIDDIYEYLLHEATVFSFGVSIFEGFVC